MASTVNKKRTKKRKKCVAHASDAHLSPPRPDRTPDLT